MTDAPESAWAALDRHWAQLAPRHLADLVDADPDRFARYSLAQGDMLLDFSKTKLDDRAVALLLDLASAAGVEARRDAMFAGARINTTEDRAVLHAALRAPPARPVPDPDDGTAAAVAAQLARMRRFAEAVRAGTAVNARGEPFTDVVNIGIGGSDLGPAMAVRALAPYHDGPRVHFLANVDGAAAAEVLDGLDPARTLVLISSKTFTTVETMTNARTVRAWLAERLGTRALPRHLGAITARPERAADFGVAEAHTFGFWDWVGGRTSVWGSVGLPLMIAVGPGAFADFLAGGAAMDAHFRDAAPAQNLPLMLGLVGVWHRSVCGHPSRAVLPYDQRLERLPAYLQQLDMESNGKSVTRDGAPVGRATGPVVWGAPGTTGQHAFFQLLHQGTQIVPCEFMVAAQGHEPWAREHHDLLVANCVAQAQALMRGRSAEAVAARLRAAGMDPAAAAELAPHRAFAGDRPSTMLLYRRLDPETLGRIVALYEHRVFVEGTIWGINSFDQWGVELGKDLATALYPRVAAGAGEPDGDPSTDGILRWCARLARAESA